MILVVQGDCTSTFSYIVKSRFSAEATEGEETDAHRAIGEVEVTFNDRSWKLLLEEEGEEGDFAGSCEVDRNDTTQENARKNRRTTKGIALILLWNKPEIVCESDGL